MPERTHITDAEVDPSALSMVEQPPGACVNYAHCENIAPGENFICDECLDRARTRDREADYDNYGEYLDDGPRGVW